jgi:hypothetical protein
MLRQLAGNYLPVYVLLDLEDTGIMFLRNVGNYLPADTV